MKRRTLEDTDSLRVVVVGPTPPPVHGVAQVMGWLLESPTIPKQMLLHLDTSDRRSLKNLGRADLVNVLLGLRSVGRMVSLCVSKKPSLAYYTLSQSALGLVRDELVAAVARFFGLGVVVQLAGSRYGTIVDSGNLAGRLIARAIGKASLVLVLGNSQVEDVVRIAHHERVNVAPNGLPPLAGDYAPEAADGTCCFLYLGALQSAKGVIVALDALAEASGGGRDCCAVFAGAWADPSERELILQRVEDLGIGSLVEFPGVVGGNRKEELFGRADVYLLPSFGEGQPVSILEAMARGLPVVSTRVGAVPDTVVDGETGILVEPGDSHGLAMALEQLIDDAELRTKLGAAGKARFSDQFALARTHEVLLGHFLSVAKGRE